MPAHGHLAHCMKMRLVPAYYPGVLDHMNMVKGMAVNVEKYGLPYLIS